MEALHKQRDIFNAVSLKRRSETVVIPRGKLALIRKRILEVSFSWPVVELCFLVCFFAVAHFLSSEKINKDGENVWSIKL